MFEDFERSDTHKQSRARWRGCMASAVVLYGAVGASVIIASARAREAAKEEDLVQVEFAPPPPPPEPPPPPPPEVKPPDPAPPRPKAKRPELVQPTEIPEETKESDAELVEPGDTGPVDGFTDGVEGGTGTAPAPPPPPPPPPPPAPPPPKPTAPVALDNNEEPEFPYKARAREVEGVVRVKIVVNPDGSVADVVILDGPDVFYDAVKRAVKRWRFKPATQGGKPVRGEVIRAIRFRLDE